MAGGHTQDRTYGDDYYFIIVATPAILMAIADATRGRRISYDRYRGVYLSECGAITM